MLAYSPSAQRDRLDLYLAEIEAVRPGREERSALRWGRMSEWEFEWEELSRACPRQSQS